MAALKIDADALFRAVVSHDYKLMGYYLDLRTGEVRSQTLSPDQVKDVPRGPSVKPLPAFGHDINERKGDAPFGPPPVAAGKKPDLFKDDGPKKNDFEGGFWKRDGGKKLDPFGDGGYRKESATKKLAELFGEKKDGAPLKADPFAPKGGSPAPKASTPAPAPFEPAPAPINEAEPLQRIPPASEEQMTEWMRYFAKDCGDPEIREKLLAALGGAKPLAGYERVLRNYQRMNQQWDRYLYKQALHYAAAWLKDLPIQWEIVEPNEPARPV
ncbi:MAG: hypothetical protein KIS92_01285 [Planctomycetota bacterium]|nr:hypothetical protein [Planctomycetota bacterium]